MAKLPWLSAVCIFTLVSGCVLSARSQTPADASKTSSEKSVSSTKSQPSAKSSGTTSTATQHKSRSTTHTSSAAHSKSNVARTPHPATTRRVSSRKKKKTTRGQKNIDSERAQEIQEALIREHYLTGEATGTWNQASEDAMRRYQADHGWQTKEVPDSRALINLGLGPSHDHLLNPESAMTTEPSSLHPAAAKVPNADPAPAHVVPAPDSAPVADPKPATDPNHNSPSPQ
jgi:hypothetical protein